MERIDKYAALKSPRNRLYPGSKLSEYMTLRVIDCYAENLLVPETYARLKGKISTKTLYKMYQEIRGKLCCFLPERRDLFVGCGAVLACGLPPTVFIYDEHHSWGREAWKAVRERRRGCPVSHRMDYLIEAYIRTFTRIVYPESAIEHAWNNAKRLYSIVTQGRVDPDVVSPTVLALTNWLNTYQYEEARLFTSFGRDKGTRSHLQVSALWKRDLRRLLVQFPIGSSFSLYTPLVSPDH